MSLWNAAIRSTNIQVVTADDQNRVIAFRRWDGHDEFFVVGSVNNIAFAAGYWVHSDRLGNDNWSEVFNSDTQAYDGWNVGNAGGTLVAKNGASNVVIPASGFVVLLRA